MQAADGQWVDESCFNTEFSAYISALTKSTSTMATYRVYDSTCKEVTMAFEMGMEIDVDGQSSAACSLVPLDVPTDGCCHLLKRKRLNKSKERWQL